MPPRLQPCHLQPEDLVQGVRQEGPDAVQLNQLDVVESGAEGTAQHERVHHFPENTPSSIFLGWVGAEYNVHCPYVSHFYETVHSVEKGEYELLSNHGHNNKFNSLYLADSNSKFPISALNQAKTEILD